MALHLEDERAKCIGVGFGNDDRLVTLHVGFLISEP